jgi:hypothetical protein
MVSPERQSPALAIFQSSHAAAEISHSTNPSQIWWWDSKLRTAIIFDNANRAALALRARNTFGE